MSKKASGAEASLLLDGLDYYETMIMDRAPNPTKSLFPHRRFLRHFGAKSYAELSKRRFEEEVAKHFLSFARAAAKDIMRMWENKGT